MTPPEAPAPNDLPVIPGYDLLEQVGEGGMGQVYRAVQRSLNRTVAVKILDPLPTGSLTAFQRESHLMAALVHPHIVTIHDCGQVGERCYLVMEYIEGASLRSRMIPGRPWSIPQAAAVVHDIAGALSYIHSQGILHLDLKPENVLCSRSGTIKITDFGLSVHRLDARTLSSLGFASGTVDYCSPEQFHGLPVDARGDLFSLAAVSYELLTGRLPGRAYIPASQWNPRLTPQTDAALQRALSRDPDERYATVEEFRQELLATLPWRKSALSPWASLGMVALAVMLLSIVSANIYRPQASPLQTATPAPGAGKVWVKDVEMFTWEAGSKR